MSEWTAEEDEYLRRCAGQSAMVVGQALGRGPSAVKHRRRTLGLLGSKPDTRPWTEEEFAFIADHDDWSNRRIAEELGRSRKAVEEKRRALRQGWVKQREEWTDAEDQTIRDYGRVATADQLQDRLPGRSKEAIMSRRQLLGIETPTGNALIPYRIGARPLIAKTCNSCGRLLQADWFWFDTFRRTWTGSCRRCQADKSAPRLAAAKASGRYVTDEATRAAHLARHRRRMDELTRPSATRTGEEYSDADLIVLADPDLTLVEKAVRTHRTYEAVKTACHTYGYRSHRGLGEPEDLWRIFNPNEPAA